MARSIVICTAALGLATLALPSTALAQQDRVSSTDKGSLIVISKVELRWENVPPFNLIQDTFIHLTNDYPAPVDVKMYFVNGDAPVFSATWDGGPEGLADSLGLGETSESRYDQNDQEQAGGGDGGRDHPGWNWLDNVISLTANEPAYWAASTGLPKGVSPFAVLDPGPPPGRPDPNNPAERHLRGYILAFAVDIVEGAEIRWNHLAGDATIVNYAGEWAYQYGGWSFQVDPNLVGHGEPTGTPGHLALDGTEYAPVFAELLMNFVASGGDCYSGGGVDILHDTDLTIVPAYWDHRQETEGPRTVKVSFDIWNENEVKFTNLDRCVTCWDQELLSRHAIPNHFLVDALQTGAGKARMDGLQSFLCPDSQATALLGVAAKIMDFNPGGAAAAGNNLVGMGTEDGGLWYDSHNLPPESTYDPPKSLERLPSWLDNVIKGLK